MTDAPALTRLLVPFTLVLARLLGVLGTAPVFASHQVPIRFRAVLALFVALLVTPLQSARGFDALNVPDYLALLGCEALVGIALGISLALVFSGIRIAGQLISQMGGLQLADLFSPATDESVPVVSELFYLVTLAVFLISGGHRKLVEVLLDTFRSLPLGKGFLVESFAGTITTLVAHSFVLGIRAAAPVLISLLLATIVSAIVARSLPQLGPAVSTLSLHALVMLSTLGICLGGAVWVFDSQIDPVLEAVVESLSG